MHRNFPTTTSNPSTPTPTTMSLKVTTTDGPHKMEVTMSSGTPANIQQKLLNNLPELLASEKDRSQQAFKVTDCCMIRVVSETEDERECEDWREKFLIPKLGNGEDFYVHNACEMKSFVQMLSRMFEFSAADFFFRWDDCDVDDTDTPGSVSAHRDYSSVGLMLTLVQLEMGDVLKKEGMVMLFLTPVAWKG